MAAKRTWRIQIRLEERGETSYSSETIGSTELAISDAYSTEVIGGIVAKHADVILATARETRPDPVSAEVEV